ncbi:MAG: galactokinase [Kiritimatiellaeota bacterium]|nr:galactokinase [Kiritimatiellota bacterium]
MLTSIKNAFFETFGRAPEVVTRAPGRIEFLGNHTDYNEGVVLSLAVDRATWVAAAAREDTQCRVHSLEQDSTREFPLDVPADPVPGDWVNYVKGVLVELRKRGYRPPAFDAVIGSTVPMSAGMSSSAALEMSFALAMGRMAGIDLPWTEWARIGQGAENNYVGARTGLLDQFSSLRGRKGHLVFSDFRTLEVDNVPLPDETAVVVADSMVKHQLTNEYNERRSRCEEAVAFLKTRYDGVTALRDVTRAELEACKPDMDIMAWRRAMHVVGENERVFAGVEALAKNDLVGFGRLMFESHESARTLFENSCVELDILVEIGRSLPGCFGARLSGGGFGGISVHLVQATEAENYARRLGTAYQTRTDIAPDIMLCQPDDGAAVVEG